MRAKKADPKTGATVQDADLYRLLVSSVTDYAIFALDPTGRVLSWNAGAQRLKGYAASEIVGQSFTKFYEPERIAAGFPEHELAVATREGRSEDEGWRVRKNGARFWANVVITALRDADGKLVGFAKVTRDLTARREAEDKARKLAAEEAARAEAARRADELSHLNAQLEEQAVELEAQKDELQALIEEQRDLNARLEAALSSAKAAYRELDQFAYVASHDLKAPLRGIFNLAQWIQDDAGERLDAEATQHLRLLQGRVHRMEALIDGILAYSRAGRVLSSAEPVDTGVLVRDVIEMVAPPEGVTIDVAPNLPVIQAERVPLQQVFLNLVGNAVKHSRTARPDVRIAIDWRDAGDTVEFTVSDNGPGIAPEYQERIWEIFQTLEARDKVEGTGIGLAVVKKIVDTRGGRVWVESMPSHGATFGFAWPKTPRPGAVV